MVMPIAFPHRLCDDHSCTHFSTSVKVELEQKSHHTDRGNEVEHVYSFAWHSMHRFVLHRIRLRLSAELHQKSISIGSTTSDSAKQKLRENSCVRFKRLLIYSTASMWPIHLIRSSQAFLPSTFKYRFKWILIGDPLQRQQLEHNSTNTSEFVCASHYIGVFGSSLHLHCIYSLSQPQLVFVRGSERTNKTFERASK